MCYDDLEVCTLYTIKQFLQHKARKHQTDVIIVNEAYTTKSRICYGAIRAVASTARYIDCRNCHIGIKIDFTGAHNLLKWISDSCTRSLATIGQHHHDENEDVEMEA